MAPVSGCSSNMPFMGWLAANSNTAQRCMYTAWELRTPVQRQLRQRNVWPEEVEQRGIVRPALVEHALPAQDEIVPARMLSAHVELMVRHDKNTQKIAAEHHASRSTSGQQG